jgi:hypothetical protein
VCVCVYLRRDDPALTGNPFWWWHILKGSPFMFPSAANVDMFGVTVWFWNTFKMGVFNVPLATSFVGARPLHDWTFQMLSNTMWHSWIMMNVVSKSIDKRENGKVAEVKRFINYPTELTAKGIKMLFEEDMWPELGVFLIVMQIALIASGYVMFLIQYLYVNWGEGGLLKFLRMSHTGDLMYLAFLIPSFIFYKVGIFRKFRQITLKSKHLLSAQVFKQRLKMFESTEHGWLVQTLTTVILFTICMPYGMAMQSYGISDPTHWPSPMNYLFHQPGSKQNLIGAPVFLLTTKAIQTGLFLRYQKLRWAY